MKRVELKGVDREYNVGKILCVGRNYAEHAEELGNEVPEFPIIFMKPPSTLIYGGEPIIHPDYSNEMHHEVELVLLIGHNIKNASLNDSEDAIAGYAVGLDMTLRDLQRTYKREGSPWTLAKCFDTCAVVSDFVSKENYMLTGNEKITLHKNGKVQQISTVNKMIFNPPYIVQYLSRKMTLEPGDLIFTGTPEGVSKVKQGDVLISSITNIGKIENIIQ